MTSRLLQDTRIIFDQTPVASECNLLSISGLTTETFLFAISPWTDSGVGSNVRGIDHGMSMEEVESVFVSFASRLECLHRSWPCKECRRTHRNSKLGILETKDSPHREKELGRYRHSMGNRREFEPFCTAKTGWEDTLGTRELPKCTRTTNGRHHFLSLLRPQVRVHRLSRTLFFSVSTILLVTPSHITIDDR